MEGLVVIVLGVGMVVGYTWLISDFMQAEIGPGDNDSKEVK